MIFANRKVLISLLLIVDSVSGPTEHIYAEIELKSTSLLGKPSESSDTVYSKLTLETHQGEFQTSITIHKEPLKTASTSIVENLRMKLNTVYKNMHFECVISIFSGVGSSDVTYAQVK